MDPQLAIGHYRITAKLGQGGMGEVYRATDTKLGREVAIKILPQTFADDPDRLSRFSREAHVLASLNHSNIGAIYGLEDHALVMELVEGTTLAERMARGPMPIEEALPIARQIADALAYAHERGVVHRDLKPANIRITPEGRVKVLDFGLAKALGGEQPAPADLSSGLDSPTLTIRTTKAGVIMGTAAYMAPEQARGQNVDRRADIWSFGVVLWEMLTGRRLFAGPTISDTIAAVLKETPDLSRIPVKLRPLLRRCLERDPKERLHDIDDAWALLEESREPEAAGRPERHLLLYALSVVLAAAVSAVLWLRAPAPPSISGRFLLEAPGEAPYVGETAVSPDGRYIVLGARKPGEPPSLWLRQLNSVSARLLPGTDGAFGPFWSADSRSIGFFAGGKLKRTEVAGGPPQDLVDAAMPGGGAWNRAGLILYSAEGVLFRVRGAGGPRQQVTELDPARKEEWHSVPQFLPDGKRFLYFIRSADPDTQGVYAGSLENPKERLRILTTGHKAQYVPVRDGRPGYLLWLRKRTVLADSFDAAKLRLGGNPAPVADGVAASSALAEFWTSDAGPLVFRQGAAVNRTLTWFDRQGKRTGTAGEPHVYQELALSPDGSQVAVFRSDSGETGEQDLWLIDVARGSSTRLTPGPTNESYPVWSADGKHIAFGSSLGGLYAKAPNGLAHEELLLETRQFVGAPLDWSADGRFLLYLVRGQKTLGDLWALPLQGDRKPAEYLATEFDESHGKFSPDGKWVAYESNVSGKREIYVSPFPNAKGAGPTPISNGGGRQPRWRRDGRELFYLAPDNRLVGVEVFSGSSFKAGVPRALFLVPSVWVVDDGAAWTWDLTRGGQRFLFSTISAEDKPAPLTVVLNWQAELKK
ncbi:MAG: protein kinase [Acidobacteriia bacterium]|nr:protein kinase [Terriglobia bacterium]